jgi:hypothetical protein
MFLMIFSSTEQGLCHKVFKKIRIFTKSFRYDNSVKYFFQRLSIKEDFLFLSRHESGSKGHKKGHVHQMDQKDRHLGIPLFPD